MSPTVAVAAKCKPFLKWAGGKGQLIRDIESRLPREVESGEVESYVEPFVGGGAVFFHVAQKYTSIRRFYLFDVNSDLVNCYNAVKVDVEALIKGLKRLEKSYMELGGDDRKEFYLDVRRKFNVEKKKGFEIRTAAKLIFLNKTCYNGLYRVNRRGEFNVPFGQYKKPTICAGENLRQSSAILQKAEIHCGDFTESERYIAEDSFVYFDPPYRPISRTASFTSYSKDSFSEEDQMRLAEFCRLIHRRGAKILLSNSDPKNEDPDDYFFESHYEEKEGFSIARVQATRAINCKASGRGQISELLITSYRLT